MNVSFIEDEPLNTVIVDSSNGQPLYEVTTPWKLFGRTTTIRRLTPGTVSGQGEVIAQVRSAWGSGANITIYGSTMDVKDWLRKGGIFTSSRVLTANDGKTYKWRRSSGKLNLKATGSNVEVAQSHQSKSGWFGTPRKMNIDIAPHGMHFRDIIVISFIILEQERREARRSSNAASLAATSSAAPSSC
ncbi:hypothetical protein JB92DRAFT_2854001 [Gautieria morchelliformis]|nr:hypothetical protein JB92DRAFT_2854001 [Gautieria morchelliformis]